MPHPHQRSPRMNQANSSPLTRFLRKCSGVLLAFGALAGAHGQTVTFTTLSEFSGTSGSVQGTLPTTAMFQASDGHLYGTALQGGTAAGLGSIYKVTLPAGSVSILRQFTGAATPTPGYYPLPGFVQNDNGDLIGLTSGNGTNSNGTIFSLPLSNSSFTTQATFNGTAGVVKGASPRGSLIKHSNGWFYGTTELGGANNLGTLFKFKPATATAIAQYVAVVEFTGNGTTKKGEYPNATLLDGGDGYLYGTTYSGGSTDYGTVFKLKVSDETFTTLATFTNAASPTPGKWPIAQLCKASNGLIYGTTVNGGATNSGVIFRLDPVANTVTTIVEFTALSGAVQGSGPFSGLVEANDGNLYGTTYIGGTGDFGTIYRYNLASGTITPKLIEFTGMTGSFKGSRPWATMIKASDGNLYGTTREGGTGGTYGYGTIFKLAIGTQPAPTVTTSAATSITSTSATLNGQVNPQGAASTWQFEYGGSTSYGSVIPVTAGTTGNGSANESVSISLSGLTAGATYHYRLKATNAGGTNYGTDAVFTATGTPQAPIVVTGSATGVTSSGATLNGTINPQGYAASWQFEYGSTTSYGSVIPVTAGTTGSGSSAEAVNAALTGLPPGITVYYRLTATNAGGTVTGSGSSFTTTGTAQAPAVVTGTVTNLTDSSATLNGTVNPRGTETSWQFEYGSTPAFGSVIPVSAGTVNGLSSQSVSANLTGLAAGSLVYFRLTAISAASPSTVLGSIGSFVTLLPPEVVTQAAIGVTKTNATLLGSVNPRGAVVTWQFEYGSTASYGSVAPLIPGSTSGSNSAELVSFNLTGLSPGSTWYYRLKATTAAGTNYYGNNLTVTTLQPPTPVTGAALSITATGVSLEGTVNPRGAVTSWQFDYGATTDYGFTIPIVAGVTGSGNSAETVTAALTGLLPNTTYHFRLRASNVNGSETGADAVFTTANNIQGWRQLHFGTTANSGNAANDADPDRDGVVNLLEYGFGMNPTVRDAALRPLPTFNGSQLIASFSQPLGVTDVAYTADVSTNLTNWSPIADGGSGRAHTFAAPNSAAGRSYMRLKVSLVP